MLIPKEICDQLEDEEMVALALKNMDYYNCIVLRFNDKLFNYVKRISGANDQEIEDVLQESFIKIWTNLNGYRKGLKLSSWVYRITHNVAVSRWRKSKTAKDVFTKGVEDIIKMNYSKYEEPGLDEEMMKEVLSELKPKYREVLILKYFEALSYEEISDILKIPEGTVAVRINRAKKILRNVLEARP